MGIGPLKQGEATSGQSVPVNPSGTIVMTARKIAPDHYLVAENNPVFPKEVDKVDQLIQLLYHPELNTRKWAAEELAGMKQRAKKAGGALLSVLTNRREDKELRGIAAYGLGWIGYREAFSALAKVGVDRKEPYCVRSGALEGLAFLKIATKKLVRDIRKILKKETKDEAKYLRMWAATSLKVFGLAAREAIPELVGVLKKRNEHYFVTMEVILALGKMGNAALPWTDLLIARLKSESVLEREIAALALGMIGGGEKVVQALSDALTGENWAQVKDAAALSLRYGNIGPELIAGKPIGALADNRLNNEEFPSIVERAFRHLGSLDLFFQPAVGALKRMAAEQNIHPAIRNAANSVLHDINVEASR